MKNSKTNLLKNNSLKNNSLSCIAAVAMLAFTFIFAVTASAQTETVLYSFQGDTNNDGANPSAPLIWDASGNLYGTTYGGGYRGQCAGGCGTVFELSPNGTGGWTEAILHIFQGNKDGAYPIFGGLTFDAAGNLYGTTSAGGTSNNGTVFRLSPNGDGTWKETILHMFTGGKDGSQPYGSVAFDKAGNLYGTTYFGGIKSCGGVGFGCGVVFKLTAQPKGLWQESILHIFTAKADGGYPYAGPVLDAAGNVYGTGAFGGSTVCGGCGVVYKISPNGSGGWSYGVLYTFLGGTDGANPEGPVILDGTGNLYGTTNIGGGTACNSGCGTVYELTPEGGTWTEHQLYAFQHGTDGALPIGGVTFDSNGNLFGATNAGGVENCSFGCGAVYKLSHNGGTWTAQGLYSFMGTTDGNTPEAGVVLDGAGNIYGTTHFGGNPNDCAGFGGCGVVYEITP